MQLQLKHNSLLRHSWCLSDLSDEHTNSSLCVDGPWVNSSWHAFPWIQVRKPGLALVQRLGNQLRRFLVPKPHSQLRMLKLAVGGCFFAFYIKIVIYIAENAADSSFFLYVHAYLLLYSFVAIGLCLVGIPIIVISIIILNCESICNTTPRQQQQQIQSSNSKSNLIVDWIRWDYTPPCQLQSGIENCI